jgi:4-amino-4-deoxy-L-arabinose transferase-like glycosyltransferase
VTQRRRLPGLLLLLAALVLVGLGQFYLLRRPDFRWDGVVFHLAAAVCFLLAWRQIRPGTPRLARQRSWSWGTWSGEHLLQAGFVAMGLLLSLLATLLSQGRSLDQPTGDVVLAWLLAVALVSVAALLPVSWRSLARGHWSERLHRVRVSRQAWLEGATVLALTILAFLLRATALGSVPYTLGGDEAWHGLLARQVVAGQVRNPFVMGYMSMPTFFYWPLSWSLRLVGNNMVGLRFPAAFVGTITVPILYFFARDLWGRRVALLSALLLATYDYHIHYSRLGANNVWDPLFVLLVLWLLHRGLTAEAGKPGRYRLFLAAGVILGFSFYFYTGARLLPVLVAVYVGFIWVQKRGHLEGLGRHLVLLGAAFLVAAGPMIAFALSHSDEWNARINQVGIIQSGWLAREPGLTGQSTFQVLAGQFLRAAGAFHVFPDRTAWYGADRPLLGVLAGAFAILGMAWAVARWRERRHFLVLIWFWSVIIAGGMLTESPPSSQRLVIAIPAVVLLVAIGLEKTVQLARRVLQARWPGWESVALGVLVAILAVSSVRFYFVQFTPSMRYGSQNGETATMIGHYLRDLDGNVETFFFGAPRIYWSFGTMMFLAPNVSGRDVLDPVTAPPDFEGMSRPAVFVFLPERAGEVTWVEQAYPQGSLTEVRDEAGEVRFLAYAVP